MLRALGLSSDSEVAIEFEKNRNMLDVLEKQFADMKFDVVKKGKLAPVKPLASGAQVKDQPLHEVRQAKGGMSWSISKATWDKLPSTAKPRYKLDENGVRHMPGGIAWDYQSVVNAQVSAKKDEKALDVKQTVAVDEKAQSSNIAATSAAVVADVKIASHDPRVVNEVKGSAAVVTKSAKDATTMSEMVAEFYAKHARSFNSLVDQAQKQDAYANRALLAKRSLEIVKAAKDFLARAGRLQFDQKDKKQCDAQIKQLNEVMQSVEKKVKAVALLLAKPVPKDASIVRARGIFKASAKKADEAPAAPAPATPALK